jgi:hypothetical protein
MVGGPLPKTLTKAGRKPNDEPLPDQGCEYAPSCASCPWRECYYLLPPTERRVFKLAWRTLETFKAAPDTLIPT